MTRHSLSRLLSTLFAALGFATANAAMASGYTGFYVFGDSLSDSGNAFAATGGAMPPFPYYGGRFSNGPTYAEDLAARLGLAAGPSLLGGSNFAFGGATAGDSASPAPSLGDQVSTFRALPGNADDGALYVLWAGGNDLRDDPSATGITSALTGFSMALQGLYEEGARNFLVLSMPNLGLIPEALANGTSPLATVGSTIFNYNLDGILGTLRVTLGGSDIRTLDTFSLISGVVSDPVGAGFGNVTDACFDGVSVCADPDGYLFWDGAHPTAAAHRLIADAAFDVLAVPEPETYALMLAGIGLIVARTRCRANEVRLS